MIVNKTRVLHRQDIGMYQACRDLNFAKEIIITDIVVRFRNFQCNSRFMNGISGSVYVGHRTCRDTTQDAIFTKFLTRSKQNENNPIK